MSMKTDDVNLRKLQKTLILGPILGPKSFFVSFTFTSSKA